MNWRWMPLTRVDSHWPRRALVGAALLAVAAWVVYHSVLARQLGAERRSLEAKIGAIAASLGSLLARHGSLPEVLALEGSLRAALDAPRDTARIDQANAYLADACARSGVEAIYLIDGSGLTIAASNHGMPGTFVGEHYGFRPYFVDALKHGAGRFYAVGVTSRRPGYYLAARVHHARDAVGVIVVKVSLEVFESSLRDGSGIEIAVADANGVVLLSSVPEWKYRALGPLSDSLRTEIEAARQFPPHALETLDPAVDLRTADEWPSDIVRAARLLARHRIESSPWSVIAVDDARAVRQVAALATSATVLAGLVGLAGFEIVALRRQRRRELHDAEVEIERRIAQKTVELRNQIASQAHNESMLRQTRDSAVQAGKLVMLGQVAAGIVHEVNQPLTALRSYTDNTRALLEVGRLDDARTNLDRIEAVLHRTTSIVRQLNAYSRAEPEHGGPTEIGAAIDASLQLLRSAALDPSQVVVALPAHPIHARVESVRLVQVLVNLLRNALEMNLAGQSVSVGAHLEGAHVHIRVADRGPGLSQEAASRLFEPFFTTKPVGRGLGLGIAVSKMIVEEAGGHLNGGNRRDGPGAEFVITLMASTSVAPDAGDNE